MLRTLRILIVLCIALLVLTAIGTLVFTVLGWFKYAIICALGAIILFAVTLVLARDIRINSIIEENEFPDQE